MGQQAEAGEERLGLLDRPGDLEGQRRPRTARQDARGPLVLRVAGQAGVMDPPDVRVRRQAASDLARRCLGPVESDGKGPEATQGQEGLETAGMAPWSWRWATGSRRATHPCTRPRPAGGRSGRR